MEINYTLDAFSSLTQLVNFIESKNTLGAGLRWLSKFETFLNNSFHSSHKIKKCNNLTFNKLELHCIYFNEWLIAFSINENVVLIEALLHKSRIVD